MSRKTKEEAEKTRAKIMASALSLFVRKGYEHTTLNDVAARLKLTKGAVYWHFANKEALLVALVKEMLIKFQRQLNELMPREELSFPVVTEMMISNAERIVTDPKGAEFFMLMQTQVRWGADSMTRTREQLLSRDVAGPYHTLVRALENDLAAGRVRKGVDPVAVASVGMSIWNGLVRSKIERFLECDLASTMRKAYQSMWNSIKEG